MIAVPARKLAAKVVKVGNSSGREPNCLRPDAAGRWRAFVRGFANLECKVADRRLVNRYNLFILEVLKAWIDPAQKNPKTIHHHGYGKFVVDGATITLKSKCARLGVRVIFHQQRILQRAEQECQRHHAEQFEAHPEIGGLGAPDDFIDHRQRKKNSAQRQVSLRQPSAVRWNIWSNMMLRNGLSSARPASSVPPNST